MAACLAEVAAGGASDLRLLARDRLDDDVRRGARTEGRRLDGGSAAHLAPERLRRGDLTRDALAHSVNGFKALILNGRGLGSGVAPYSSSYRVRLISFLFDEAADAVPGAIS